MWRVTRPSYWRLRSAAVSTFLETPGRLSHRRACLRTPPAIRTEQVELPLRLQELERLSSQLDHLEVLGARPDTLALWCNAAATHLILSPWIAGARFPPSFLSPAALAGEPIRRVRRMPWALPLSRVAHTWAARRATPPCRPRPSGGTALLDPGPTASRTAWSRPKEPAGCRRRARFTSSYDQRSKANDMAFRSCSRNKGLTSCSKLGDSDDTLNLLCRDTRSVRGAARRHAPETPWFRHGSYTSDAHV